MSGSDAPYADLDPDRILAAIESIGLCADGRVLALQREDDEVEFLNAEVRSSMSMRSVVLKSGI